MENKEDNEGAKYFELMFDIASNGTQTRHVFRISS